VTAIFQIWRIESAGGTARQLTRFAKGANVPFWSVDGQSIYFNSEANGSREIFRMPARGGAAVQVTRAGGYVVRESPDAKTLYYTKSGNVTSPLYSMPAGGGPEKKVIDQIWNRGFCVFNDGVYYIRYTGTASEIRFHDLASGNDRVIGTVEGKTHLYMSVSPDRKTILFPYSPQQGSNLMLIENFR